MWIYVYLHINIHPFFICVYIQSSLSIHGGLIPGPAKDIKICRYSSPVVGPPYPFLLHLWMQPTVDHVQVTVKQHEFELPRWTHAYINLNPCSSINGPVCSLNPCCQSVIYWYISFFFYVLRNSYFQSIVFFFPLTYLFPFFNCHPICVFEFEVFLL